MFEKIKALWAYLTAPYDEELENAKDVVCSACDYWGGFCSMCPVTFTNNQEKTSMRR